MEEKEKKIFDKKSSEKEHKKSKINKLEESIRKIEEELKEEKDKYLRLYAEFDNYKKRIAKERIELFSIANLDTMLALLPVIDDINIVKDKVQETEDNRGLLLIMDKILKVVHDKGLEDINTKKGDAFDVDLHEAIVNVDVEDEELDGKIYDIISKGYKLKGKLIRHTKVIIAKKKQIQ